MCICVCEWKNENPSLGSVNWPPNYTQGQILSHPSFPNSRQGQTRGLMSDEY